MVLVRAEKMAEKKGKKPKKPKQNQNKKTKLTANERKNTQGGEHGSACRLRRIGTSVLTNLLCLLGGEGYESSEYCRYL